MEMFLKAICVSINNGSTVFWQKQNLFEVTTQLSLRWQDNFLLFYVYASYGNVPQTYFCFYK